MWHTPSYSKIKQLGADSLWQAAKPHTLVVDSLLQAATPQTIARDGLWPSIILWLSFFILNFVPFLLCSSGISSSELLRDILSSIFQVVDVTKVVKGHLDSILYLFYYVVQVSATRGSSELLSDILSSIFQVVDVTKVVKGHLESTLALHSSTEVAFYLKTIDYTVLGYTFLLQIFQSIKWYKNGQTKSSLKIGIKTNTSLLSGHPSQECLFSFFKKLQPLSIS